MLENRLIELPSTQPSVQTKTISVIIDSGIPGRSKVPFAFDENYENIIYRNSDGELVTVPIQEENGQYVVHVTDPMYIPDKSLFQEAYTTMMLAAAIGLTALLLYLRRPKQPQNPS